MMFVTFVNKKFHIHRSKAIFDWIFSAPSEHSSSDYEMYYLSCNNVGLSDDAIEARLAHERRGQSNVQSILAKEYTTIHDVFKFLTTKHDFYTASKLVERATGSDSERVRDKLLELSYGKGDKSNDKPATIEIRNGRLYVSLDLFAVLMIFAVVCACLLAAKNTRAIKSHIHTN